jgi:tetratricopeptide (TPR) repeat protein
MRRSIMLVAVTVLAVAGGIGGYLWFSRQVVGPPPPVPPELTDPLARKLVEAKRQALLAALDNPTAWGELGMAFDAHQASAQAMICYRQAMDLDPREGRWPYLLAEQLNWRSDAGINKEEAVRLYRRAADCAQKSPAHQSTVLLTLADLLTELGRRSEAAPLYQKVYDEDQSNPWAAYRMGVALADRGETEKAKQILIGLAQNPYARKKSAMALAELNRRAGRTKDADGFDYAASLLPQDQEWANPFGAEVAEFQRGRRALMDRFVAQEEAHHDRAALQTATTLADLYPSAETQTFLLRALVNIGNYPAAAVVANDILRDPEGKRLVTAHLFLGLARLGLADQADAECRKADSDLLLDQAVQAFSESIRLKSDNFAAYLFRSKALLRLGRLLEAEESARGAIGCRPEEWEPYVALADVLAASGRKAEAISMAEQAVSLAHPNETRPRQALEALKKLSDQ